MPLSENLVVTKQDHALTVLSVIAVFLFGFHVSDDIIRGYEPPTSKHWQGMTQFTVWLFVALGMDHGRWRTALLLLGGVFVSLAPATHFAGKGLSATLVASDGALLFVTTLFCMGIVGPAAALIAVKSLWISRKGSALP